MTRESHREHLRTTRASKAEVRRNGSSTRRARTGDDWGRGPSPRLEPLERVERAGPNHTAHSRSGAASRRRARWAPLHIRRRLRAALSRNSAARVPSSRRTCTWRTTDRGEPHAPLPRTQHARRRSRLRSRAHSRETRRFRPAPARRIRPASRCSERLSLQDPRQRGESTTEASRRFTRPAHGVEAIEAAPGLLEFHHLDAHANGRPRSTSAKTRTRASAAVPTREPVVVNQCTVLGPRQRGEAESAERLVRGRARAVTAVRFAGSRGFTD
jgi:hypothetical protein